MWTGEQIRSLRERYGETQEQFRGRLRIKLGTLRHWEQGHGDPSGPAEALLERLEEDLDNGQIRPLPTPLPSVSSLPSLEAQAASS